MHTDDEPGIAIDEAVMRSVASDNHGHRVPSTTVHHTSRKSGNEANNTSLPTSITSLGTQERCNPQAAVPTTLVYTHMRECLKAIAQAMPPDNQLTYRAKIDPLSSSIIQ